MKHGLLLRDSRPSVERSDDGLFAEPLAITPPDHDWSGSDEPAAPVVDRSARYCDQPMDWRTRLAGLGGTAATFALIASLGVLGWRVAENVIVPPPAPVVVNLRDFEAPPEPVREVPEGPAQVERQEARPEPKPKPDVIVLPPLVRLPLPSISVQEIPEPAVEVIDPGPVIPATTAPRSITAPPGQQASSDAKATWEALLLAHLEKYRRYPARARAARQQGVAHVRFRMNRAGSVLSASIEGSSGFTALDRAALDTLRRAQPLPAIPEDMPDVVDLTLPVEFLVR